MMSERNSEFPALLPNNIEKGSWHPKDRDKGCCDIAEAIEELKKQLELARPLVLVSFLQMISIMFVGHLGELPLSSSTLATSFAGGTSFSFMVSNELGAGRPKAAKLAAHVVLLLAVVEGLLLSGIAVAARNVWGYIYTNEDEVVKYLAAIMPVLALSNFMDGIQGVLSGIARGCGWQKLGALVNLGAYYLAGFPCAVLLTFGFHLGGKGLWSGIISGSGLQALLLLLITLRTN